VNYVELNGAFAGAALPLALFGLLAGSRRARAGGRIDADAGASTDGASRDAAPCGSRHDPARGVALAAGIVALVGALALFRAPGLSELLSVLPGLRLAENT